MNRSRTKLVFTLTLLCLSTQNFGQNWYQQNSNHSQQLTGIQMITSVKGWACGDAGFLLSTTDGGITWNSFSLTGADFSQIVFKDENTGVVVGDDGAVFVTTNGGQNWVQKNSSTSAQLRGVAYAGGSVFIAVGRDGAIIKSVDDGNTWTSLVSGTTERLLCVSAIGDQIWIGARDGLMLYSNNGGSSFNIISNPATDDIKDIQFVNNSTGFACGSNSFFMYTSDGGQSWQSRSSGIVFGLNGLHFLNENTGWTVGGAGTLYSTTNAGLNWNSVQPITSQDLNSIHTFDGINLWTVGNGGVIVSNFGSVPVELVSFRATASQNKVLLEWITATEINNLGFEIERSQISAGVSESWETLNVVEGNGTTTETSYYNYTDEKVPAGKYLYRLKQIDHDGTFEYSNEIEVEVGNPNEFSLSQNYPNPFNPSTKIRFTISADGSMKGTNQSQMTTLKVYNVLGNEVATLVNEQKSSGSYEVDFDASNLSSGTYFYKLESGNQKEIRKMILLR